MNSKVVLVNCKTLEQAKFRIKTSMGISEEGYSHTNAFPVHGTGQGSGNSPTIWCFVCSILFDALDDRTTGAKFFSPDKSYSVQMRMIGFIDDCSQRVNRFEDHPQPSAEDLVGIMQREAQVWNDLLWASGGELEQQKCSYHLIQSGWNARGVPYLEAQPTSPPMYLTQNDGTRTKIIQKSNYQAHKTLGCYIEPAMTMTTQERVLRAKNETFTMILRTNYFSRREAWTLYTSVYLPSMTYPFPNIVLRETVAKELDQIFMATLVPQCGYNRKMATAIRYAPRELGGAGFRRLYVEWGCASITQLIQSLRTPQSYQGKMTMIALAWAQQYIGTSTFILDDTTSPIPACPNSYIIAIREFLRKIQGRLVLRTNMGATLLRERDKFIMDIVMQIGYPTAKIDSINACRRYLQASTLADIVNDKGDKIEEEVWNGTRITTRDKYRFIMFNQKCPSSIAWGHWRSFLRTVCRSNRKLETPLGHWIVKADQVRHPTKWVYDPNTDQLYKWARSQMYYQCRRLAQRRFSYPQENDTLCNAQGFPTWVQETPTSLIPMTAYQDLERRFLSEPTFPEYIQSLELWERGLIMNFTLMFTPAEIMTRLNRGPVTSASDGSVRGKVATFGAVVTDSLENRLLRGSGQALGSDLTSLRSEAYGCLATCRLLLRLSEFTRIPLQTPIIHVVDNKALISRVNQGMEYNYDNPASTLKSEWDIINAIIQTLKVIPTPIKLQWVKGHQDEWQDYSQLPLTAKLNCEADRLAALHYNQIMNPVMHEHPSPFNPVQLIIRSNSVTNKYRGKMRIAAALPSIQEHTCKKFHWHSISLQDCAWDLFSQIVTKDHKHTTTIIKHIHGIAPTGHIAHRNDHSQPSECPSCGHPSEDNNHVITCPAVSRTVWRQQTLDIIHNFKHSRSDPILKQIMLEGLRNFHDHKQEYKKRLTTKNIQL